MARLIQKLKTHFLEGFLALLPLSLTAYVVYLFFKFTYNLFDFVTILLPPPLNEKSYFQIITVFITIAVFIIITILIGIIAKSLVGSKIQKLVETAITSLPGIKPIYNSFKQLFNLIFRNPGSSEKKVVLIEYPLKGKYALAFLTGKCNEKITPDGKKVYYTVFMPTTPNPTTGFLMLVEEKDIIPVEITMDEAIKVIFSGGLIK
ncbi:MAG: DUF502 domain-containing protein [Spirochaetota bacterium]